jgi:cell division protein FtsI (penicillin-binding protein 3)
MQRRDLLRTMAGIALGSRVRAESGAGASSGCALLLDIHTGRMIGFEGGDVARRWLGPPGSTMKPLSLLALLEANKLSGSEEYFCPGRLALNGRSLNCSHPYVAAPMNLSRAIAYSCNCAVAHFAQRFEPGELAEYLRRAGLCSPTGLASGWEAAGHADAAAPGPASQLQALGESGVSITPLELLAAYRRLALRAGEPLLAPITEGLEGAVEFGTARAARMDRMRVAGKTGSVRTAAGARIALFAGFAPSRSPEIAAVVLTQGRSGGGDAAPIAGRMFSSYFAGRA